MNASTISRRPNVKLEIITPAPAVRKFFIRHTYNVPLGIVRNNLEPPFVIVSPYIHINKYI